MFKRLLASLNHPKVIRTVNLWMTIFWCVLIAPTLLWWRESILWVALLSIWANVVSHYTAYLSARVEVREEEIENAVEDIEEAVDDTAPDHGSSGSP